MAINNSNVSFISHIMHREVDFLKCLNAPQEIMPIAEFVCRTTLNLGMGGLSFGGKLVICLSHKFKGIKLQS